jgi:hypothetical protein
MQLCFNLQQLLNNQVRVIGHHISTQSAPPIATNVITLIPTLPLLLAIPSAITATKTSRFNRIFVSTLPQ